MTSVKISDEAVKALAKVLRQCGWHLGCDYKEDIRHALQAAIPLVVEGLIGPMEMAELEGDEEIDHDSDVWTTSRNSLRSEILAKVKK